jgi:hypothetical protein
VLLVEVIDLESCRSRIATGPSLGVGAWAWAGGRARVGWQVEMINLKLSLITTKPVVYLVNMSADDYARKKNKFLAKIHK